MTMQSIHVWRRRQPLGRFLALLMLIVLFSATGTHGAMLYKDYVVRYDRGWDILCDPYQVEKGDWVLKIFRQKGEIAHEDFREFLGIFQRLNPHVKDIDRIRPGQVVDIPLKKLVQGNLPGQSSGVVTIPFVMINNPKEQIKKHSRTYTIKRGDTISQLIAKQFGGRYGDLTYNRGLNLLQAMNPHIKDVNQVYAGQRIYMPDPSIREQAWYSDLFDAEGKLVADRAEAAEAAAPQAPPPPAPEKAPESTPTAPLPGSGGPTAEAAAVMGGRLLDKGTYYLPMKQGKDFELDLSRYPMIDLQNGSKVIMTTQDSVMNVDLPLIQSYWNDVKAIKVPENATSEEILEAVLGALPGEAGTNRLAFDDDGVSISVSAKWIHSAPSADGRVPRHTCITPISSADQRTHNAIVRYLDRNDIIIKEVLTGSQGAAPPPIPAGGATAASSIDGSSQQAFIASFARSMGFNYAPNIGISFPYAGIQVKALSNLLSFGNGKELLVDFGDLYGDAINAIKETGLDILQIDAADGPVDIIQRLMNTAGMAYTRSPVFYAANRPAEFNTAITVDGTLVPDSRGENRLFVEASIPPLIEGFLADQGIQIVRITDTTRQ